MHACVSTNSLLVLSSPSSSPSSGLCMCMCVLFVFLRLASPGPDGSLLVPPRLPTLLPQAGKPCKNKLSHSVTFHAKLSWLAGKERMRILESGSGRGRGEERRGREVEQEGDMILFLKLEPKRNRVEMAR